MLAPSVGVTIAHLIVGDAEIHHGLSRHDIEVVGIATAEILGVFRGV
jgi:hypothetical protein